IFLPLLVREHSFLRTAAAIVLTEADKRSLLVAASARTRRERRAVCRKGQIWGPAPKSAPTRHKAEEAVGRSRLALPRTGHPPPPRSGPTTILQATRNEISQETPNQDIQFQMVPNIIQPPILCAMIRAINSTITDKAK